MKRNEIEIEFEFEFEIDVRFLMKRENQEENNGIVNLFNFLGTFDYFAFFFEAEEDNDDDDDEAAVIVSPCS